MGEAIASPAAKAQRLQTAIVIVLLALAVLIVLSQANPLTTRLGRDSGMYAYVASHLERGDTPYVSAWEHKPPGIFFIDALGLELAGGTRWGIWFAELISLLVATIAGYFGLRGFFNVGPALLASLVWLAGLSFVLEGGNFTEEFSLPFYFMSLLLFGISLRRPASVWVYVALGLSMGCTFMLRPNNIGPQAAMVLVEAGMAAARQRTWRATIAGWAAMGLGFLIPSAAAAAYFASRDALQPFIEAAFLFNAAYGGRIDLLGALVSGVKHLGFAAGAALAGTVVAFGALPGQLRNKKIDPILLWLGLDFLLEIFLSGLSGRNYPHYFITWLPWVAVASALLVSRLAEPYAALFKRQAAPALLAGLALMVLASMNTLSAYRTAFTRLASAQGGGQREDQLAAYVNENTAPGQTVYVWGGEAGINFLSRRDAPTAHFSYAQLGPSPLTERLSREFYEDITSEPPALIIDQPGDFLPPLTTEDPERWLASRGLYVTPYIQEFFDFVRAHYTLRTHVTGARVYALE
jgi:hypothetical protein